MKKIIVYVRVSTEEQFEKGYSIDSQIEKCKQKAIELGYVLEDIIIIEDHVSGTTMDREGLIQLREIISGDEKPVMVIIYDPDRLARNLTHQLIITDEIVKSGIQLEFVNFEWKNTPEGMMYYQLRGIFSQYEREKIRERTIRGRIQKIKKYRKLSYDPRLYGYTFDTAEDVLVINPAESQVVKLIFQWAAEGMSGEGIAKELSLRGIPAPRGNKWYGATVTRILHNKSYLGTYMAYKVDYHQGYKRERSEEEQFPIEIEPIIEESIFQLAQKTLEKNRTNMGRPAENDYLVRGLGKCFCGRSIVSSVKSGNRKYTYYSCVGKHKTGYNSETREKEKVCNSLYWNSTVVDTVVWDNVKSIIMDPKEILDEFLKKLSDNDNFNLNLENELLILMKQKDELTIKKNKLLDLYLSESIDKSLFEERVKGINEQFYVIGSRIEGITAEQNALKLTRKELEDIEDYLKQYQVSLETLSFEDKKKIIDTLVSKITFNGNREITITLNIAQAYP